jgi:TatD DNase family protein
MQLVDIGVNLTNKRFRDDWGAVVDRAAAVGVDTLILTGTNVAGSTQAADLAAQRDGLFATAGVHPHDAKGADPTTMDRLRALAARPEVVALGECGLDFDRDFSPRPVQEAVFEQQLALAGELGLPVFLHERAAHGRFRDILARARPGLVGAVVHCFTGTADELRAYLDLDCHLGITGWICDERRGDALRAALPELPLDRLLLETDAPYLTPRDLRPKPKGGRNEPSFLPHIARAVAALLECSPAEVAAASTRNARRLFKLP